MLTSLYLILIGFSLVSFALVRNQAKAMARRDPGRLHSLPAYHGMYAALWAGLPAFAVVILWLLTQGAVVDRLIIESLPPATTEGLSDSQVSLILSEIKSLSRGNMFGKPRPEILEAAVRYNEYNALAGRAMFAVAVALSLFGFAFARYNIAPQFRARHSVERVLDGLMVICASIAILTTAGIIASLLFESSRFFARVPVVEFLFGLRWEPQIPIRADQVAGLGAFGAVPVFTGTLLIAAVAMAVATPVGLLAAIYLTEFASPTFRAVIKPLLEILAGIPTVVYGFFAVLIVSPAVRTFGASIGIDVAPTSGLVAGAVMGIMIIPFVSSLSDDALNAVPQAMRDGSYALGATHSETILRVLLPAALPGIMGGILLAVSRAIGETMIVVMAAGLIANLTFNPLEGVTTVTVQIVTLLIGDTEFDNPKTLAAFALGLVLFIVTLVLNVIALTIVRRYREQYE